MRLPSTNPKTPFGQSKWELSPANAAPAHDGASCAVGEAKPQLVQSARPDGASTRWHAYLMGVPPDIDQILSEREDRLQAELAELTKPLGDIGTISFGKRVGDGTSIAVDRLTAVSAQEQLLAMLDGIRRARQRVADGSYGLCEVCGETIPEERLKARPWAIRCIQHS